MTAFSEPPPIASPLPAPRAVWLWLWLCAALVFVMAIVGAITRLTESGLSMTSWRPLLDTIPPLSEARWMEEFQSYQATPEYRFQNNWMELDDFKYIYMWEWIHRLLGHVVGIVYALPLALFWLRGKIPAYLKRPLIAVLILGLLQAGAGAFMVASGLTDAALDRPNPTDVSHLRLALHLGLALMIFAGMVGSALLARGGPVPARAKDAPRPLLGHARAALALLAVTIVWGAFVAGLDAGRIYNSFPLMGGQLVPAEAFATPDAAINDAATVQLIHRVLGIVTALALLVLWARGLEGRLGASSARVWLHGLALTALAQVALGIAALLLAVPVALGALHQAGAVTLLGLLTGVCFHLARPPATMPATALDA